MKHLEQVAALLVSEDPRHAADKVLGLLSSVARASAAALLAVDGSEISVFASRDLPLDSLTKVRDAWRSHRRALAAGKAVKSDALVLAPVRDGGELVAVLCLQGAEHFAPDDAVVYEVTLAKAVRARRGPQSVEGYLTSATSAELQRDHLLTALSQNEWNISRVARILGVTRRTVYLRLQRFGIARKRVPKTLGRRPATA